MPDTAIAPAPAVNFPTLVSKGSALSGRQLRDKGAKAIVLIGGFGVIAALLLIFAYLVFEILPLMHGATFEVARPVVVGGGAPRFIVLDEKGTIAVSIGADGTARVADLVSGKSLPEIALPGSGPVTRVDQIDADKGRLAVLRGDGRVYLMTQGFTTTYDASNKAITTATLTADEAPGAAPADAGPGGDDTPESTDSTKSPSPATASDQTKTPDTSASTAAAAMPTPASGPSPFTTLASPATDLVVRESDDRVVSYAVGTDGRVTIGGREQTTGFDGTTTATPLAAKTLDIGFKPLRVLVEPGQRHLLVVGENGELGFYDLGGDAPTRIGTYSAGGPVLDARFLAGGISTIVTRRDGVVEQWFPARDKHDKPYLAHVRDFGPDLAKPTVVVAEQRRRGFAVADAEGNVAMYYATSHSRLARQKLFPGAVTAMAFNSRANTLVAAGADGTLYPVAVHNDHPEVSFSALWGKVWYESYQTPEYIWQSSSASGDFEPKFSLMPLAFGTVKGAFFAMLFAIPMAIASAIFVAYFMSPELRQIVKPTVELLAALPSVILGFLAGLWLAPFIEANLPGTFLLLVLLPASIPIFGFAWSRLPERIRHRVPAGWEAALLIPVVLFMVWLSFAIGTPLELALFGGTTQSWMDRVLGIHYQQRNALVVGIAMGVAVIPVIFSIAEDALFSVPKHLSMGSLALGASTWQTLVRVVLPTASPGIFSAVMIGLGRAVGETMIVLMATGNTPVMDFSLFDGMRTLSANVAVEMPESEVGSTHFRLLFLSGLVLFIFTFIFNTMAELVRARLRKKYSSI